MSVAWNFRTCVRLARTIALTILAGAVGQAQTSASKPRTKAVVSRSSKVVFYAAVGNELGQYDVDAEGATLVKRSSVLLPANVQYAWPHPSKQYLYVAWSNRPQGNLHGVGTFRIDPLSGALRAHGQSVSLPARPIHLATDISGTHLLVAFNEPSGLNVYRLDRDGTIGSEEKQSAALDFGVYAHQVRVDPSNRMVVVVTLGNDPPDGKNEAPGALKVFLYKDGLLTGRGSIAPNGGSGFHPRNLDFWGPFVFVSLERQNKLQVYKKLTEQAIASEPAFSKDTLSDPRNVRPRQMAGAIHVHPSGKFVYQANRANATTDVDGKAVFVGGENTIAVYAINQGTGEPTLIQNIDTRGMRPGTFALDPSGRILVVGNQEALFVRDRKGVIPVPASLAVFRIQDDGRLEFVRKYDVETDATNSLFWVGFVSLP